MPPRKNKPTPKGPGSVRARKAVEGMLEGKSLRKASLEAGFSKYYCNSKLYNGATGEWIKKEVARRQKQAMERSNIHTDAITGSLVEIMQASPADILPEHPLLIRARQNGVDHLIKKFTTTPIKCGVKKRKLKDGTIVEEPIIRDKVELEMYSRLDAIAQLRDNFGMKQEPRANTFEETRRMEVEKEIDKIMAAEECDRPTAAKMLREALGNDSPLIPTVNKYVN
jgi:hypothetical protein